MFRASWVASSLVAALVMATPAAARIVSRPPAQRPAVGPSAAVVIRSEVAGASIPSRVMGVHNQAPSAAPPPPPALLVRVPHDLSVRARPAATAPSIGVLPAGSKYYHVPTTAWVEAVSRNGRWGRVEVPYASLRREGWIPLAGLARSTTRIRVVVDLSAHRLTVTRLGKKLFSFSAATGAAWSPTPPGEYFVTDRIPFWPGSALGSFAFGISGIQPHLPAGWHGGNQLAIHGTNDPSSIGTSASAGCVRVSEAALARLKPLLRLGTPVVIHG